MPWGIAAGVLGSVAGAAVSGAMSPGTSGGSGGGASYYVPTGLQPADANWQSLLGSISGAYNAKNLDQYGLQSLQEGMGALGGYGPGYQSAANNAAAGYGNVATTLNSQAAQDFGTQGALLGAGANVYSLGLDPQNALYRQMQRQTTDQANAVNAMYGLGSSAAGAGVTDQALNNFNLNWQSNQLSRALQGLQGYGNAANEAGRFGQAGTQAAAAAPGYALQSGQLPYSTAASLAAVPGELGNTYGSYLDSNVYGPAESIMGQIIPYLNYGNGAQAIPYQTAAQGAGAMGAMVSNGISNSGLGTYLGNLISPGNFTGDFSTSSPFTPSGTYSGTMFGPSSYGSYGGGYSDSGGNSYGFTMPS